MGTRGLFGFYIGGRWLVMYKQLDSYPEGLGANLIKEILKAIQDGTFDEWKSKVLSLKVVDEDIKPVSEDIEALKPYTDLTVSRCSTDDWYCLTRKCQGSYDAIFESGYLYNCINERGRPCMQEYNYIIDFDNEEFKAYKSTKLFKSCRIEREPLETILKEWELE